MKLLVLIAAVLAVACSQVNYEDKEKEYHRNMAEAFREHLFPFNKHVALETNYYTKGHFIISAHTMWYNLGFLAKEELLSILNLPEQRSLRNHFYSLASQLEGLGEHFSILKSRAVAVDETVDIKDDWITFDDIPAGMPDYLPLIKYNKPFGHVQKYVETFQPNIVYSSHTVIMDHLIIESSWSPAFSDQVVQQAPFYNVLGEQIATVEYLRMKGRVRVAHSPNNKVTVLEVPISYEGRTMVFAVGDKPETMIEAVFSGDIFSDLNLTEEPVEVAIPRLSMSSGMDMGPVFRNIRRSKFLSDSADNSGSIPDSSASPGYFHFVTVNMTDSVRREDSDFKDLSNEEIDFDALEKEGFVVNRPFLFALFVPLYQSDIKVPVFTGVYSYPGERGQQIEFDEIDGVMPYGIK